jgi:SAM-dependent methyltransferase
VTGSRVAGRTFVCADALDPPFLPDMFDRVIALNMIDAVSQPRRLLSVMDALCKKGGELILSSPYAWLSSVLPERERIGGADPAGALRALLTSGAGLRARDLNEVRARKGT